MNTKLLYVAIHGLSKHEFHEKVRKYASKDKLVIGGSGCEGTSLTIDMSCRMAAAGADAVMVLTPCYFKNKMDVPALVGHYNKVADSSPVPVFLYNIPMATGYVLFNFMFKQCNILSAFFLHS